jgi:hypothetical protein
LYGTTIKNLTDMKTIIFSSHKASLSTLVGFLSLLAVSCGSYQNSSYYDSDGIYGNSYKKPIATETQNNKNQYKDYFRSLQNNNHSPRTFTDIDNYNDYHLENEASQNEYENYPGWGDNVQNLGGNVYDTGWAMNNWYGNNWWWNHDYGWGMNIGLGWNSWYGNNWLRNSWGYANYQNDTNYSYNPSRRGSVYTNSLSSNRNYNSIDSQDNINRTNKNTNEPDYRRNSNNAFDSSDRPTFSRRHNSATQYDNAASPSRVNQNETRQDNYTPTRNNSRNQNSDTSRNINPFDSSNNDRNTTSPSTPRSENYSPSTSSSSTSGNERSSGGGRRGGR